MMNGGTANNGMSSSGAVNSGIAKIVVVGLAAGFLSGLFGVGGGVLMVPGLVLVLGMGQRLAHGTSLAAIVPIALAGVLGYALEGEVDWVVSLFLVVGAAGVGAFVGTYLLHLLPTRLLALVFAAVLVATAVRMLIGEATAPGRGDLTVGAAVGLVAVGVLAGTLSGLLGVGGGVITVPALVLLLGVPAAVAKGSSLAVIIPTAVVGTQRNRARGNVDLRVAAVVGLSGVVSSFLASQLSVGLDERLSNRLFAGLLLAVAAKLIWDNRRPAPVVEGEDDQSVAR
ncbi:MAG TPA: sulfite exporter TauE/SafE family protein [Acidimicrobiales bacterium]|nr:sulfite exporter TauE/SafE family protein [Acidimicrobiales bacterium]